ncbi:MAG: 4'-phosphopantetheinyl transferase superfamily protein [Bacteroidetes bacterium]|nr:4'-phosphopantetheinyl transferase superfamily protein [Bacteroidota bacterium]
MPLIFEKILPFARLGIWNILEDEAFLRTAAMAIPEDLEVVDTYKNESRRKQWFACRALLAHLLQLPSVNIRYDEFGKPSLEGFSGHISLSHTSEYAAVLVDHKCPAGIDIEKLKPRIERVAARFLQEEELVHIRQMAKRQLDEISRDEWTEGQCHPQTELLYLYWCSKEALYKFYGKPSVDLKNDIYIGAFDYFCNSQATFAARVRVPEGVGSHDLQFKRIGDHMLVYTLSKQE